MTVELNKEALLVEAFAKLDSVHSNLVSENNLSVRYRIKLSDVLRETAKKVEYIIDKATLAERKRCTKIARKMKHEKSFDEGALLGGQVKMAEWNEDIKFGHNRAIEAIATAINQQDDE